MSFGINRDFKARSKGIKRAMEKAGFTPNLWKCKTCGRENLMRFKTCPRCDSEKEKGT